MPKATQCTVCRHRERAAVELALARGVSVYAIAKRHKLGDNSLYRHRRAHMPATLKAKLLAGPDIEGIDLDRLKERESQSLLANLIAIRHRLFASLETAEENGDGGMIARMAGQLHENLSITGKLLGDLGVGSTTINNVLLVPAYVEMRVQLVRALQPYPEARQAVAAVLHRLEGDAAKVIEHEDRTLASGPAEAREARGERSPAVSMSRDLARALDPVLLAREAGIEPDGWQAGVLRSAAKRSLLLCCRQSGKTTTTGLKGLHRAIYKPKSTTLILSPSQRQSAEMQRSVMQYCSRLRGIPGLRQEAIMRSEFDNGSRIIALPGTEATVRGYAAVDLVILDEASRVPDELLAAVRPMLATSNGELIALTTPAGKRGFFYGAWTGGGDWERTKITADQCPRITPEFLADELRDLGPSVYSQEYFCEFVENDAQVFPTAVIERAFSQEVQPLW